jgi:hypothetical protein
MNDIDILNIDIEIHEKFRIEESKLTLYRKKLKESIESIESDNLTNRTRNKLSQYCEELSTHIYNIESRTLINFYITETESILEKYREIIYTPIKTSFIGKVKKKNNNIKLINEYLEITKKYSDINIQLEQHKESNISCNNCPNKKKFEMIENNTYVCLECFSQQEILLYSTSYKDIDRINISTKYKYDRKVHFRDCFNQYQGKQNCTIPQEVYTDLEQEFEKHHLLQGDSNTHINQRFSRITKEHIIIFFKELGYTKHYENVNLIYYTLTGVAPDDISHLEDILLQDFDTLTELYDKIFKHEMKIERKNFINTQYVLYQLLKRHKHPCRKEDFSILKTIDRKAFHDNICQTLFTHLGWNIDLYF